MAEKIFPKGMRVNTYNGQYGDIIKLGIDMQEFQTNEVNERGYVNIDIKQAKSGKWYAEINTFNGSKNNERQASSVEAEPIDPIEIPF